MIAERIKRGRDGGEFREKLQSGAIGSRQRFIAQAFLVQTLAKIPGDEDQIGLLLPQKRKQFFAGAIVQIGHNGGAERDTSATVGELIARKFHADTLSFSR